MTHLAGNDIEDPADDGDECGQYGAAGGEDQAGPGGGVAELLLGELRYQDRAGVEHHAHDADLQPAEGKISVFEDAQVDHGIIGVEQIADAEDEAAGRRWRRRQG